MKLITNFEKMCAFMDFYFNNLIYSFRYKIRLNNVDSMLIIFSVSANKPGTNCYQYAVLSLLRCSHTYESKPTQSYSVTRSITVHFKSNTLYPPYLADERTGTECIEFCFLNRLRLSLIVA